MRDRHPLTARPAAVALRGAAVAALLLSLVTGTVLARGTTLPASQATPVAGDVGEDFATTAAVPADVAAYVSLNLDPASAQFQDSAALSERAGFIDLVLGQTMLSEQESAEAGDVFAELGLTEVGVGIPVPDAAALANTAETAEVPDLTVVLATTDPDAAYAYLTEELPALTGAGEDAEETTYEGVTIVSQPDGETSDSTVNIALVEDLILVSPTVDGVERSIDVAAGRDDDITTSERYQQVRGQLDDDSMLFAYADTSALYADPDVAALLEEMGIGPEGLTQADVYTGLLVRADIDAPGFRLSTVSFPDVDGGAAAPSVPAYTSGQTSRVPATTMVYLGGSDIGALLGPVVAAAFASSALTDLVGGATDVAVADGPVERPGTVTDAQADDPEATPSAGGDVLPEQTPASGEDLTALAGVVGGFLSLLNGEYVVAIEAPEITSLTNPNAIFALFATGTSGGALIDSVLDLIADQVVSGQEDVTVTSEVVDGNTIYTITTGDESLPITVSYGVVDGQLLVGLGDSLESYLAGFDETLADDDQFQATFDALGVDPASGAVVYLDLATLLPLVQTGAVLLGGTGSGVTDDDPACAEFESQSDAQAAYDDDPFTYSDLDLDFDGQACEDYFAPTGTPVPTIEEIDFSAVVAYGQVTFNGDGFTASEGLFLLAPAG